MDKASVYQSVLDGLHVQYEDAIAAANRAHQTATDNENVADNKYDTLGLEASYLAHGQSERVSQCERDLNAWQLLDVSKAEPDSLVEVGSLVCLVDDGQAQWLFLGPRGGGLKIFHENMLVTLITPSAPMGRALLGCAVDEEVRIHINSENKVFEISQLL